MNKPVDPARALHQFLTYSRPQRPVNLLHRTRQNDRKRWAFSGVAETRQLLQRLLRFGRYAVQLSDHELNNVICVAFGANSVDIPGPLCSSMIKGEHFLRSERR